MPATGAVKTLAASFEGMGGAAALSLIAFSVVFLVLAGLTLVIFAMRVVSKVAGNGKAPLFPRLRKSLQALFPLASERPRTTNSWPLSRRRSRRRRGPRCPSGRSFRPGCI